MIDINRLWAVIPLAGFGTRLRPHTLSRPKALLPVAGKPILGHILDYLASLGVQKILLVVGDKGDQLVRYAQGHDRFARIESTVQEQTLGLGHAVSLADRFVDDDPMLVVCGDTIFKADLRPVLASAHGGMLGVMQVDDARRFGVAIRQGDKVVELVEKPQHLTSGLALVGVNLFDNSAPLFDSLHHLIDHDIRTHDEYQLTDALQHMLGRGAPMEVFEVDQWLDCGTRQNLLDTNQRLLRGAAPAAVGRDCAVIPPVHIHESAQVESSVIGPYVSVGPGARLRNAMVRNSIVGGEAVVENAVLADSIVGFQSRVEGHWHHFNIGDFCQVNI